jgi:DNA-directed RNA polymerase subunit RPC12/RpoP
MTDNIPVSFRCGKCGTKISWDDDTVTDSTEISCPNCGESAGTYGDLRSKAIEAVRKRAMDIIKDTFKGR